MIAGKSLPPNECRNMGSEKPACQLPYRQSAAVEIGPPIGLSTFNLA